MTSNGTAKAPDPSSKRQVRAEIAIREWFEVAYEGRIDWNVACLWPTVKRLIELEAELYRLRGE